MSCGSRCGWPRLGWLLVLALAPTSSGCVLLPTLSGPIPRAEGSPTLPHSTPGLRDLRGIIHAHSWLSHDSQGEFADIAAAAREVGVSFVILTDHLKRLTNTSLPSGSIDGVLFLPGIEKRSYQGGSLLILGARAGIDPTLPDAEVAEAAHAQGALVGLGHPEKARRGGFAGAEAVELMNLHADVTDENYAWLALRALALPPGAFFRSLIDRQAAAAAIYDGLARSRPVAALGACDAHEAVRLLGPWGWAVDSYQRVFRLANTHVLAEEVSRESILAALRAGRSYAACELDQDATGFRFFARRGGKSVAILGGEVPSGSGVTLVAQAPVACALTIFRDGAPFASAEGTTLEVVGPKPGAYRVEAQLDGTPWVATSAIRVGLEASGEPR